MQTLQQIHQRQRKATFALLIVFALGWAFTEWQSLFLGLIVGTSFGLYNFWILVRRFEHFEKWSMDGKKRFSLGTGLRFGSGIAAAAIALAMPAKIDLTGTIIGFAIPYVLLLGDQIIYHVRHY